MRSRKSGQKIQRRYEGKKVLLVEDNELNREIATAIMEELVWMWIALRMVQML